LYIYKKDSLRTTLHLVLSGRVIQTQGQVVKQKNSIQALH
jgi:hypothetical protein